MPRSKQHSQEGDSSRQGEARPSEASPEFIAYQHQLRTDALPYMTMLLQDGQEETVETSTEYIKAYLKEMAPRSPMERMLAMQMLWQHVRIGKMVKMVSNPSNGELEVFSSLNATLETAMNTYRRQVLAYQQLREPVQPIKATQLNVAKQQVVAQHNQGKQARKRTRAQEKPSEASKELPPVREGPDFFDQLRQQNAAVGAVNGTAHRRG